MEKGRLQTCVISGVVDEARGTRAVIVFQTVVKVTSGTTLFYMRGPESRRTQLGSQSELLCRAHHNYTMD